MYNVANQAVKRRFIVINTHPSQSCCLPAAADSAVAEHCSKHYQILSYHQWDYGQGPGQEKKGQ